MHHCRTFFVSLVMLSLLALPAHRGLAEQITSSSNSLLSGATVFTFESTTSGTYSALTISGVTFTADPGKLISIDNDFAGQFNNPGKSLHNSYESTSFGQLTINFGTPVSAFGFNWGASDYSWTLTAYSAAGANLGSYSLPITHASNAGDFVGLGGFSSSIASATLIASSPDYIFVDNFSFVASAVPEPSTYAGFAGLAALAFARYRRSRRSRTTAALPAAVD